MLSLLVLLPGVSLRRQATELVSGPSPSPPLTYNFTKSPLLPLVDCIRVITLEDSDQYPLFVDEMNRVGIWDRVTVQTETRDPEGTAAGCSRAHMRAWAWGAANNCSHLLVFEDDVFFEDATLASWAVSANHFLRSDNPYDILLMGWDRHPTVFANNSHHVEVPATWAQATPYPKWPNCTYRLHQWAAMHAYIISNAAMHHWSGLKWSDSDKVYHGILDHVLPRYHDRGGFYSIRPKCAFQRFHRSSIGWDSDTSGANETDMQVDYEFVVAQPSYVHMLEEDFVYDLVKPDHNNPTNCYIGVK